MDPSLKKLMELGYNVGIECKGKGREYEMTFEATATRVQNEEETYEEYVRFTVGSHLHAVGNTIEEVSKSLLDQMLERHY